MGITTDKQCLIAELCHQINSPLAAIRNALYLASCQTEDPLLRNYLELADEEITAIVSVLRASRRVVEEMAEIPAEDRMPMISRRAAA